MSEIPCICRGVTPLRQQIHDKQESRSIESALYEAQQERMADQLSYEKEQARLRAEAAAAHETANQREKNIIILKEEHAKMQSEILSKAEEFGLQKAQVQNFCFFFYLSLLTYTKNFIRNWQSKRETKLKLQ